MKKVVCIAACISLLSCTKAVIEEPATESLPTLTEKVFYDSRVETIMFNSCVTCHSGATASAGVVLSDYSNVKFHAEQGKLVERMNDAANPMPPSGLLPVEQRQVISKWVLDGFPEKQ